MLSVIPAAKVFANGNIEPSLIKQESLLIIEEGTSKGKLLVLGYPKLDEKTKAAATEMLRKYESAELSSAGFAFDGRIIGVLLKCTAGEKTVYRSVSYDTECDKILTLGDILAQDAENVGEFIKSHAELDGSDELYLDANEYDFILSGETLAICVPPSESGDGFLCVLPIADNGLLCNAVRKGGLYPWEKARFSA